MDITLKPFEDDTIPFTKTLQNSINACNIEGGGTITLLKGKYLVGTIYLKSNVRIHLERGSVILGSTDIKDYPNDTHKQMYRDETHMDLALFYAKDCENIIIDGYGEINGQSMLMEPRKGEMFKRPMMFRYHLCKNIRIEGIKLTAPASWTHAFIGCEDIWVNSISIFSRAQGNGDGLDFDGCSNVFVSNCKFNCSDDCICLQNSFDDRVCENVLVTNCMMESKWAGMRIGLLSCAPIKNLTVTNCIFKNIDCSGLKIQSSEGSVVENMTFSNLVMENVVRPILITANRRRERTETSEEINTPSIVRNLSFSNIVSVNTDKSFLSGKETQPKCIVIDADPEDIIDKINLNQISMTVVAEDTYISRDIPTFEGVRAEGFIYKGLLPAYGLFSRNTKNLNISNFSVFTFGEEKRDKIIQL